LIIEEIASFCKFKKCEVRLGNPAAGFIEIDGSGPKHLHNYGRYLAHNELAALPSPREVLEKASIFKIEHGLEVQTLDRQQFEQELENFRQKVGI
jgi:hypothetical protein